jgi:hypothetical protein
MDFLDPVKHRAHNRRLLVGYVLIGIAILLAVTVLLYLTRGFTLKQGKIVQNGLVFVSSNPGGANIYLNDKLKDKTATRMTLEAGNYTLKLARDGYHDWQRAMTVAGGDVLHIDYPFLVPNSLVTSKVSDYKTAPGLSLQSPDRRWLVIQKPGELANFDMYDLKDPKKIAANETHFSLPENLLSAATGAQSLKLTEWSNDNVHVVVQHIYGDNKNEYILIDRKEPAKSVNLTKELKLAPTMRLALQNKKFDRYFVYNTADKSLNTETIKEPTLKPMLQDVLAYKSYGDDTVLYATNKDAGKGRANINIYQDGKSHVVRGVVSSPKYLLELSRYSGDWYAVIGSAAEGHVYIYEDPADVRDGASSPIPIPANILKITGATRVSFSASSQFIAAENGRNFAVYDIENDRSYAYSIDDKLDKPQTYATWMDDSRLQLISGGKIVIFDYDGANRQQLVAELAGYKPYFDSSYRYLYSLSKPQKKAASNATNGQAKSSDTNTVQLTTTSMRTPDDQ